MNVNGVRNKTEADEEIRCRFFRIVLIYNDFSVREQRNGLQLTGGVVENREILLLLFTVWQKQGLPAFRKHNPF